MSNKCNNPSCNYKKVKEGFCKYCYQEKQEFLGFIRKTQKDTEKDHKKEKERAVVWKQRGIT